MSQISLVASKSKTIVPNITITGAASAGGLIALTAAGHGLESGDIVQVKNVGGVAAATGQWIVTVTSSSVFNLNNSVFGGSSYTSGGTASHLGFCTAGTITDNTVIDDIVPSSLTLKVQIEALGSNSVSLTIEDTVDSAFLTAEPVCTFHAAGAMQMKVADSVLSRRISFRRFHPDAAPTS